MPTSPQHASSAILEREGRYLLVRRAHPPSADMYAFPGGRAEPGETPDQTALRELREETGIVARDAELFATYDLISQAGEAPSHFFLSVFRVSADGDQEGVAADDAAGLGWYTADEISALPAPPSVRACIDRLERQRTAGDTP